LNDEGKVEWDKAVSLSGFSAGIQEGRGWKNQRDARFATRKGKHRQEKVLANALFRIGDLLLLINKSE